MHSTLALHPDQRGNRKRPDGFRLRIGGGPRAAGRARNELARLEGLDTPTLESLRLLVTELVTNSVRHAGAAAVDLVVLIAPKLVRVEISNPGSPFEPRVRTGADLESESGWGLFLVERLSDSWGVVDESGYQRVWFEICR